MNRYYSFSPMAIGDLIILDENEAGHAKVLREQIGNSIEVFHGDGSLFKGEITHLNKKKMEVQIISLMEEVPPKSHHLHIAIAPTKNIDRFEFFIEKAVELGVDEISPIVCFHSERKTINMERIKSKALSACKQSGQLFLPKVNEITNLQKFADSLQESENILLAHCAEGGKEIVQNAFSSSNILMIGPEGDFSAQEIQQLISLNAKAVSLGNSRLRTETAGIYAAAVFKILFS